MKSNREIRGVTVEGVETQYSPASHNHDAVYAKLSHGNHVPATEAANNAKFLRNDGTWAIVTPANIGAAASSHGTHVTYSTTVPVMDGTASAGSASTVARSDHRHPTDTSRAAAGHTHSALSLTLNGSAKSYTGGSTVALGNIYAPTAAGTEGQVLQSSGSGAPVWGELSIPSKVDGNLKASPSQTWLKQYTYTQFDTGRTNLFNAGALGIQIAFTTSSTKVNPGTQTVVCFLIESNETYKVFLCDTVCFNSAYFAGLILIPIRFRIKVTSDGVVYAQYSISTSYSDGSYGLLINGDEISSIKTEPYVGICAVQSLNNVK